MKTKNKNKKNFSAWTHQNEREKSSNINHKPEQTNGWKKIVKEIERTQAMIKIQDEKVGMWEKRAANCDWSDFLKIKMQNVVFTEKEKMRCRIGDVFPPSSREISEIQWIKPDSRGGFPSHKPDRRSTRIRRRFEGIKQFESPSRTRTRQKAGEWEISSHVQA